MPKWAKAIVALLLLPLCLGTGRALGNLLTSSAEHWSVPGTGTGVVGVPLIAGAICWLVIYLLLPRPLWIYVFGHELTHALWAWLFGARLKQFRVSSRGGHVKVTRINFLIVLAPYFFPLYAAGVAALYGVGSLVLDLRAWGALFLVLLGAAYSFHVTLTVHALRTEQTDITSQGYLFSAVVIWLGNAGVLLTGLPLLLGTSYETVGHDVWTGTRQIVVALTGWVSGLPQR